jgi:iron uptake system component EfeO
MMRLLIKLGAVLAVGLAVLVMACGDDDDSGSGSASTSASGLSLDELEGETDNPLLQEAVTEYKAYVEAQIDEMIAKTTEFTDAIRAGDLEAAQAAYAPSRVPWERIEPIAALIEEIDGAVDARVDDFAGVDDPEFTGWHRLEYILFELEMTDGAAEFADKLDEDLQTLKTEMADLELPPAAVAVGAAELIEEVSEGKITGEEDRYSKTDLWDFKANVEGAEKVIELLTPALEEEDPELLADIDASFGELNETLSTLQEGDGWVLFCQENDEYDSPLCSGTTVSQYTIDLLKAQLAALSENISLTAGALGLS